MGQPRYQKNVKLITGFLFRNEVALDSAEKALKKRFGPTDYESAVFPFLSTDYYAEELGAGLKRKFIGFKKLVSPEGIHKVKLYTNHIERLLSSSGRRTVNIDPGYLTEGKLILLTTKDHSHRVYLAKGIYAESTLKFYRGTFVPWDTTYPDYRSIEYIRTFNDLRDRYIKGLHT